MKIEEMAKAHLDNVSSAINDLLAQKKKIQDEVERLSTYISQGEKVLLEYQEQNKEKILDTFSNRQ